MFTKKYTLTLALSLITPFISHTAYKVTNDDELKKFRDDYDLLKIATCSELLYQKEFFMKELNEQDCKRITDSINHNGETHLHQAAQEGNLKIAELLINKGASITAKDFNGNTPLFFAALRNKPEIIDLLFNHKDHKELLNATRDSAHRLIQMHQKQKDYNPKNTLELAMRFRDKEIIDCVENFNTKALLQAPAAISQITRIGNTRFATL